jgi:hypothetical protein
MASVELQRLVHEWRIKFQRIREILQPPQWDEQDWNNFSVALALLAKQQGSHWEADGKMYWDLRWSVKEGGELVCQIEQTPGYSLVVTVAQNGGFAGDRSYVWLWAELDQEGRFLKDPYFTDGAWKEALMLLMLPMENRAGFLLESGTDPRVKSETKLALSGAKPNNAPQGSSSGFASEIPK